MQSKANDATQASKRPWRGILFVHIENIFKKMKEEKCFIVQGNQAQVLQNSCGKGLRSGKFLIKNLSSQKSVYNIGQVCLFEPASVEMSFSTIKKTNKKPRGKSDHKEPFFKNN